MAGKKTYTKLGAILAGKKGPFLILGNSKASQAKYNYDVEVKVTNGEGKVLANFKNGLISCLDPRKRPNITEDEAKKIPDSVEFELFYIED